MKVFVRRLESMNIPRVSNKEHLILSLLAGIGEQYSLEIVKNSEGKLKRGTVYVTLNRMIKIFKEGL